MKKKKFHRYLLYAVLRFLMALAVLLPYRAAVAIGAAIGRFAWSVLAHERSKTLDHLRLAFGAEKKFKELEQIGRRMFDHYGRTMAEWVKIDHLIKHLDEYVTAEGYEHLERALKKGRGIVIVAAHFGNWELMAGHIAMNGIPLSAIARKIYIEQYDRMLTKLRRKMNVETIYRHEHPRRLLKVLHDNRALGFVVDQAIEDVDAISVNFFGRPAWTPVAPARFARATGAALIPMFIVREGEKHRIVVEPPIELVDTRDRAADIRKNTEAWVAVQETYIRRYPHLWVWNHRRWKEL